MVTVYTGLNPNVSTQLPHFAACVYHNILGAKATSSGTRTECPHRMHTEMTEIMTFVPCHAIIRTGVAWLQEHFPDACSALLD